MNRKLDRNSHNEALDRILTEFFREELGDELPPLPVSATDIRPVSVPPLRERLWFGGMLAASIACLMGFLYLATSFPRTPAMVRNEPEPLQVTAGSSISGHRGTGYLVFDQTEDFGTRVVERETERLVIERRAGWRHVVWHEAGDEPTVWMAFPVIDIEWSLARNDPGDPAILQSGGDGRQ